MNFVRPGIGVQRRTSGLRGGFQAVAHCVGMPPQQCFSGTAQPPDKQVFAEMQGFLLIIRGFVKVSACNAEHERCKKSLPKRKLRLKTLTSSP